MGNKQKGTKKPKKMTEEQALFDKMWKPLVCNRAGRLDKALVMQELLDYALLMQESAAVYHHVTGGKIGSPAALAEEVIAVATDVDNEALQEILKDERERWAAELESADDVCFVALGGKTKAFEGRHARVTTPEGSFVVAWCSDTDQLFSDEENPLPHTWRDTARDAIKALLGVGA